VAWLEEVGTRVETGSYGCHFAAIQQQMAMMIEAMMKLNVTRFSEQKNGEQGSDERGQGHAAPDGHLHTFEKMNQSFHNLSLM